MNKKKALAATTATGPPPTTAHLFGKPGIGFLLVVGFLAWASESHK